jgi:prepilin-type N-terminal cleavage/methylation domain-containing protein
MKMHTRSTKGFTLVEIMIVVVIIGLLAAMAIPAFQKVRESSIGKTMDNDARQLASAAQQYILENPTVTTVTMGVGTDGSLTGNLSDYVHKISKGVSIGTYDGTLGATVAAFTMKHQQYKNAAVQSFDAEGKHL